MKLFDELDVYVEVGGLTVRAGRLGASFVGGRSLGGSWFTYDQDYFSVAGAYELSPDLPRTHSRTYSGPDRALFFAFQDLTPDDWGRMVMRAKLASDRQVGLNTPVVGDFDYLALASDESRLGAIRFASVGGSTWLSEVTVPELEVNGLAAFTGAAARFEEHEADERDLMLLGAPGTSAGGARPKVAARVGGELKMLKLPSSRDGGRDGEAWEFTAIQLAEQAGLEVQTGRLCRPAGMKSTLVLYRFDRTESGNRIGFISARTAMELPDHTFNTATYEDFADCVDMLTGGDRNQLRELFKRIAFTVLINNIDDHWKNHGFLRGECGWRLSPAFDVNPSPSIGSVSSRQINSKDDPRKRSILSLVASKDAFGLSKGDAGHALAEVLAPVRTWEKVAASVGIAEAEMKSMAPAFSTEQQQLAEREIARLIA
ncbi:type II toxin-antitoxin system HipA family toxin [Leucobacter sp. cx-328]|uniref:type II toxin-antitoxin system HipA family toxin n=1 Tax=unclassified Leucobacter TaxID=2621730 RepID=UPI00165E2827|nr:MULTISPECIES: HipA domain-containing protein [unclassified Leucobacter]MBC9945130.1 type II toxin-antitoxin system HipA family toxin [Leucobacter sp. cx-328]